MDRAGGLSALVRSWAARITDRQPARPRDRSAVHHRSPGHGRGDAHAAPEPARARSAAGSRARVLRRRSRRWTAGRDGIEGLVTDNARFGSTFAVGRFTARGHLDLAVGNPAHNSVDTGSAGTVNVIYGSPRGLSAGGNQQWTKYNRGSRELAEDGYAPEDSPAFGTALVAADFGRGPVDGLAVGVPGAVTPGLDSGPVQVIYGTPAGLNVANTRQISQETPGIRGDDEDSQGAQFGASLAIAGPFTASPSGDGYPTLVVGALVRRQGRDQPLGHAQPHPRIRQRSHRRWRRSLDGPPAATRPLGVHFGYNPTVEGNN